MRDSDRELREIMVSSSVWWARQKADADKERKRGQHKDEPSRLTPKNTSGSHYTQHHFRVSISATFSVLTPLCHFQYQTLLDVEVESG